MVLHQSFLLVWCMLAACMNSESQIMNEKRLLLTDPDYTDNQQIHRDIQLMKATMSQLQATVNTLNNKVIVQDRQIQSQASVITTFQNSKHTFIMYLLISVDVYNYFVSYFSKLSLKTRTILQ